MEETYCDWNDTALIEAYDRIVKMSGEEKVKEFRNNEIKTNEKCTNKEIKSVEEKVKEFRNNEIKTNENCTNKEIKSWRIGHRCRALHEGDGNFYEATLIGVKQNIGFVRFVGYGNKARVHLTSLKDSKGKKARRKQYKNATKAEQLESSYYISEFSSINDRESYDHPIQDTLDPGFSPFCGRNPQTEQNIRPHAVGNIPHQTTKTVSDATLNVMLHSWYMAGYYTGLHQKEKSQCCPPLPKQHHCDCIHHVASNNHGHTHCIHS